MKTPNSHLPTAYDTALDCLSAHLACARKTDSRRIPPLSQLAREANVSAGTMLKAIALLRSQGLISVSRGKGIRAIRISSPEPSPVRAPPLSLDRPKWRRVALRIRRDISSGDYLSGDRPPSAKELMARYDTCARTLAKALAWLEQEGVLTEKRHGLAPGHVRREGSAGNTIVLVLRGDSFDEPSLISPRTRDHLREMENVCTRAGVRLEIYTCYYILRDLQGIERIRQILADPQRNGAILGFVLWTMAIEESYLARMLETMQSSRKPVAVFDEIGAVERAGLALGDRTAHFTMATSANAGHAMARYLNALGHRCVAVVSMSPLSGPGQQRYTGMVREYDMFGLSEAVRLRTSPRRTVDDELSPIDEDQNAVLEMLVPRYIERTQGQFSVRERIAVHISEEITAARGLQRVRDHLFPALEKLLRETDITAWVGATETEALVCLDFLRLNRIAIPQKMSVVGFDDGYPAFSQKLTSYNFGGRAYMFAIVNFILRFDSRLGAHSGPIEFDGFISERSTVGRAL